LQQHAKPTRAQIEEALKDNLCRCGVHERVIKAVLLASGQACTNTNNSVSIQGLGLGS